MKEIDYRLVRCSIANEGMLFADQCDAVKEYPRIEQNSMKYEEKETPVKPNFALIDEWYGDVYECYKCNKKHIWEDFNYCPNCGQKLNMEGIKK